MLAFLAAIAALAPEAAAEVVKPQEKDPIVCERRAAPLVGTRLRAERICMPKSEWAEMKRRTERGLQGVSERSQTRGTSEGRAAPQ